MYHVMGCMYVCVFTCLFVYQGVWSTLFDLYHDFSIWDRFLNCKKLLLSLGKIMSLGSVCAKLTEGGIAWGLSDVFKHSPAVWLLLRWPSNEEPTGAQQLNDCLWESSLWMLLQFAQTFFFPPKQHFRHWHKSLFGQLDLSSIIKSIFWHKNPRTLRLIFHQVGRSHNKLA